MTRSSDSNPTTPDSKPTSANAPVRLPVHSPSGKPHSQGEGKKQRWKSNPPAKRRQKPASQSSGDQKGKSKAETPQPKKKARKRISRKDFDFIRSHSAVVDEGAIEALSQIESIDNSEDDGEAVSVVDRVTKHRRPLSSFMVSMTIHLIFFLALTWLLVPNSLEKVISLEAAINPADPADQVNDDTDPDQTIRIEQPEDTQSPIESDFDATAIDMEVKVAETEVPIPSPVTNTTQPATDANKPTEVGELPTMPTGGGLEGRDLESRANRAATQGGSAASEAAVESGLAWIISHQRKDGSWRLRHDDGRCNGQCPDTGQMESSTAATGLALMSLLGAGYTHKHGRYKEEVKAGLEFLLKTMHRTKRGGRLMKGDRGMYSQAIATIAIAEAFVMTGDSWLAEPSEAARYYIETAQHRRGGWRYNPGNAGDMTVTGWQLMALKSCQLGGANSPDRTWELAEQFVDSLRDSSGYYGYQKSSEHQLSTTAIAALMKMYLGAGSQNADVGIAAQYLSGAGPSKTNIYYNYYATQVLFHRSGKDWKQWNTKMRDYLVEQQDSSGTHRNGSWHFQDRHGNVGGRLYTTAMAIMTLEVYYRYMPLYRHDIDQPVKETE